MLKAITTFTCYIVMVLLLFLVDLHRSDDNFFQMLIHFTGFLFILYSIQRFIVWNFNPENYDENLIKEKLDIKSQESIDFAKWVDTNYLQLPNGRFWENTLENKNKGINQLEQFTYEELFEKFSHVYL